MITIKEIVQMAGAAPQIAVSFCREHRLFIRTYRTVQKWRKDYGRKNELVEKVSGISDLSQKLSGQ